MGKVTINENKDLMLLFFIIFYSICTIPFIILLWILNVILKKSSFPTKSQKIILATATTILISPTLAPAGTIGAMILPHGALIGLAIYFASLHEYIDWMITTHFWNICSFSITAIISYALLKAKAKKKREGRNLRA